ncbi:ankyrin [Hypoxylon sp. EC38]|nr:ankyrin [Hypoxylon sp. EC38]
MEYLQTLPTELILGIIEYLDDIPDLRSLTATTRRLNYITTPVLYSLGAKKYPYLLSWACGAGLLGVVEKLLVVGLSPNLPAVGVDSPEKLATHSENTLPLNMLDPSSVLNEVYHHQVWKQGPPRWLRREAQVPIYNPNVHSVAEEYIDGYTSYWFPLHAAAMSGSIEIIRLLFDFGAYLDPPSRWLCGCSPDGIYGPMFCNYSPTSVYYWTPLHTALCCGNESTANYLLGLGASSNIELRERQSNALHWAARGGFLSTTKLLLEGVRNVSVDIPAPNGTTPLMWALGTERSIETMTCLIEHGANIEAKVTPIWTRPTALTEACYNGWYKDATFLIDAGATSHSISPTEPSALDQCLISLNAGLNREERCEQENMIKRKTRLFKALDLRRKYNYKLGKLALRPCPNDLNEDAGSAAIMELMKKLIHNGANVNTSPAGTRHPLIRASAAHLIPIMELLLASGADVNQEDDKGSFPLLAAVPKRRADWEDDVFGTVEFLLKHGAHSNKTDKSGRTTLMKICRHLQRSPSQLETVKLLVSYGADINIRSPFGKRLDLFWGYCNHDCSPLQVTFHERKYDILHYFMDQGAKILHEKADLSLMLEDFHYHAHEWEKEGEWDSGVEMNEPPNYTNVYPWQCRVNLCPPLRLLLSLDRSGWLAKDPRSLYLSTRITKYPLLKSLLDAGASDASWIEYDRSCLSVFFPDVCVNGKPDFACAQRLVSIGADVNAMGGGHSLLSRTLYGVVSGRWVEGGGFTEFIKLLTFLVDNGVDPSREELEMFEEIVRLDKIHGGFPLWEWDELCSNDPKLQDRVDLDDFEQNSRLDLRREVRRQFVVEGNKIVRRKVLTYGDVALTEGDIDVVGASGSECS